MSNPTKLLLSCFSWVELRWVLTVRFRLHKIFNSKILQNNDTSWVQITLKVTVVTKARKVLLNGTQKQTLMYARNLMRSTQDMHNTFGGWQFSIGKMLYGQMSQWQLQLYQFCEISLYAQIQTCSKLPLVAAKAKIYTVFLEWWHLSLEQMLLGKRSPWQLSSGLYLWVKSFP